MFPSIQRRYILLWQAVFLIVGTSWLWASYFNPSLSYRTSLISQYETPYEPYSLLFRIGDILAGLLLLTISLHIIKIGQKKTYGWLLFALSVGLICDPLLSTSCRVVGNTCQEYFSATFLAHAIETVTTSILFFVIAFYDAGRRKKLVSILFTVFQVLYGLLFVSQLANQDHFNTPSQYLYQTALIVWLAWLCRDLLAEQNYPSNESEAKLAKNLIAAWAFLNGVLAIVLSLTHLNLLGHIKGTFFTGDSAWLAQHGIIVGVVMLYLARHLARGEARARQIFLLLTGIEALKYSVISPNAGLLAFYFLTFMTLFLFRDDFDRGTIPITWRIRLRDLYYLVAGLLVSVAITLILLDRDDRLSLITYRAIHNFNGYVISNRPFPHSHLRSELLAHSFSVFIAASLLAILWVLFRPYKLKTNSSKDYGRVQEALSKYSHSTEDYFKLWPDDKDYFWGKRGGFIAYKLVGGIIFGLADPISENPKATLKEFSLWCRQRRLKVCFLPVYPTSLLMYKKAGYETLHIGSSAVINVQQFVDETARDKWWRWRINKAVKNGYTYQVSKPPHSVNLISDMKAVSDLWLDNDGRSEQGFAMGYFDRGFLNQCVLHYIRDSKGRLIAFTNELPQFKTSDTFTVDLLRSDAETESMAFLLYKIIETAAADNKFQKFDLGFVPFAKAKGPLLAIAKTVSAERFSAKGLEQFKNKFNPDWQPNYLAYEGDITDLGLIALNIENAMAPPTQP